MLKPLLTPNQRETIKLLKTCNLTSLAEYAKENWERKRPYLIDKRFIPWRLRRRFNQANKEAQSNG